MSDLTLPSRVRGCLLGGAIGDALGAPVEFMSGAAIEAAYGTGGVRTFQSMKPGGAVTVGLVTDDTQMTLFTIEGLIRAITQMHVQGLDFTNAVVHHAYLRWADTQTYSDAQSTDGWLVQQSWLHARRAPGATCLAALQGRTARDRGFGQAAVNDSKGCGGVMRSAPYGWLSGTGNHEWIYDLACEGAGFTHGHPTGKVASGAFALLIAKLMNGDDLIPAARETLRFLEGRQDTAETTMSLSKGVELACRGEISRGALESLGGGWIAEEALAIGVYAASCYREPAQAMDALSLAVSHGGDSDSTGSICGNILGALWGEAWLPEMLASQLEGRDTMMELADDFIYAITGGFTPNVELLSSEVSSSAPDSLFQTEAWLERYPAW